MYPHIETPEDYAEYQDDFSAGVADLEDHSFSDGFWNCPACGSDDFDNCDGCADEACEAHGDGLECWREGSFSWAPCDVCGRGLGGTRYHVIGWIKGARAVGYPESHRWEGEACVDCIYYGEYGGLDDTTILAAEGE